MRDVRMVIGLGTGRCGSCSLSFLLNKQENTKAYHEAKKLDWIYNREELYDSLDKLYLRSKRRDVVCDVGNYWLNYVEEVSIISPETRFLCLQRDKKQFVSSMIRKTDKDLCRANRTDGWYKCFPKFNVESKELALELYWELYKQESERLSQKLESFKVFSISDLNTIEGQTAMLKHCGYDNPVLNTGIWRNRSKKL